jgi:hypothetical protein
VNNGLTDTTIHSFVVNGSDIYAGTNDGVFLSTNNGSSWIAVNIGFPVKTIISSLAVNGTHIFAGTNGYGVWKRPLAEMATGLDETRTGNSITVFPNPFSTQTTLGTGSDLRNTTLTLYNSLGQAVRRIQNVTGNTMTLYREDMAEGLYFVLLTEKNTTLATKRIIVTD